MRVSLRTAHVCREFGRLEFRDVISTAYIPKTFSLKLIPEDFDISSGQLRNGDPRCTCWKVLAKLWINILKFSGLNYLRVMVTSILLVHHSVERSASISQVLTTYCRDIVWKASNSVCYWLYP